MSYSDSTIGLPLFLVSISASSSARVRTISASLNRMRPRSWAVVVFHGPSSNAARAAATARSTSALPASGTRAMTSPVDGSMTSRLAGEEGVTNSPLM
jgi:hypothetical protein